MYLIDGNNIAYISYYISGGDSDKANIRNFIKAFFTIVYSVKKLDYYNPNNYIVWDSFNNWRKKIYLKYKSNRNYDDKKIVRFQEFRSELKKKISESPNRQIMCNFFEADDVIAHICRKFIIKNEVIIIVSNDTDFYQLLTNKNPIILIRKIGGNKKGLYNYKSFLNDFGFKPELYSSYKSIVGDSSDNIPGVNGIGPKRGMEIIQKYGHLDNWLLSVQPDDKDMISKNAFSCRLKYKNVKTFFKLIDLSENYSGLQLKLTSNVYK